MKTFSLAEVLSITTSINTCGMSKLNSILSYLTDNPNLDEFNHGNAADECIPYIFAKYPQLKEITKDMVKGSEVIKKIKKLTKVYGNKFEFEPISDNPIQNLININYSESEIELYRKLMKETRERDGLE